MQGTEHVVAGIACDKRLIRTHMVSTRGFGEERQLMSFIEEPTKVDCCLS